jgi:hypothetical protein
MTSYFTDDELAARIRLEIKADESHNIDAISEKG